MTDKSEGSPCDSAESGLACVRLRLKPYLVDHPLSDWLEARSPRRFEPFYASIDLRDAGFKLAPVDANLYPAGFNNICPEDLEHSVEVVRPLLNRHWTWAGHPGKGPGQLPRKLAILPEFHTRNRFYIDNLYELRQIFRRLGVETEIGWLPTGQRPQDSYAGPSSEFDPSQTQPISLFTTDNRTVVAYPFRRKADRLVFEPFEPDFIVLNNDFSEGFPRILRGLSQPIEPSPLLGWHSRRKSNFFTHYNRLAGELATAASVDPWHLQVTTERVSGVDFDEETGLERVADAAGRLLSQLREQYGKRGIREEPFVFVKNDAGTYGMGILRVEAPEKLLQLNRRERNKMAVGKGGSLVHDVIVQEGIPTRFALDGVFAEPVIYLMGRELFGGFLRKNPFRGKVDNLNTKGMVFQKLCLSDLRHGADRDLELELVYGTIAQLSSAAMALEAQKAEEAAAAPEREHAAAANPGGHAP